MSVVDWRLFVCGFNHGTCTTEQREPLQIGREDFAAAHADFAYLPGVMEAVIVSTCNRIEFYVVADRSTEPFDYVKTFYEKARGLDITKMKGRSYAFRGKHAARHLFRVTSGVDSMVLGENQITTQMREAYSSACQVKSAGKITHRLLHQALRVGKRVRTDTAMGKGACSVSSAAIEMLREGMDASARPNIMFVGANRMIQLAASNWSHLHHGEFLFVNRTEANAVELAARFDSKGYGLNRLPELLPRADIVVTCTGSPEPIISADRLTSFSVNYSDRNLLVMDLAVPRDVEVPASLPDNVTIHGLDDVERFVRDRQAERKAAIPEAERIIERRLDEFAYWYDHVRHEFAYNGLNELFRDIYQQDMGQVLDKLSPQDRALVDESAGRLIKRLAQMKYRAENLNKQPE